MHTRTSRRSCLYLTTALAVGLAAPAAAQEVGDEGLFTMLGRIIFGAGAPKVAIDVPQSVSVLEEEDFAREQPATVGDVVENSPGISTVGSESRFGETINIRGIGTGTSADEPRIVTLIDGVKKYYESYRQGSLFTDPAFFKSVEILRGPATSTLYGSGALAGVVSFETRDASDFLEDGDSFAFQQSLEYKSNGNGRQSTSFLAFAPDQRFDGLLGFIYDDSDVMQDGSGNDIPGTRITETNALVKGTYYFGDGMEHSVEAGYVRYNGTADDQVFDVIDNNAAFGTTDREAIDETAFVQYNYAPAGSAFIDLDVQLSYGKSANYVTDFNGFPSFDSDYAYIGRGVKVQNQASWTGEGFENYLTFGVEYSEQDRVTLRDTADNAQFQPEGETETFSLFAQNEWIANQTLTVIAGARLDYQHTTPGPLVPTTLETGNTGKALTLAVHHQTTERLAFSGSASYTERLPVVDELYDSRPTPGGADQVSAGTLDPEKSRNVEVGVAYTTDSVFADGDEVALKATAFHNDLTDQIVTNSSGGAGEPTRINLDESAIFGLEVEGSYESRFWFGGLALTVMDGENKSDPAALNPNLENQIPANTLTLSLGRRFPGRNLELGWSGAWNQEKARAFSAMGSTTVVDTPSEFIHDVYAKWTPDGGVLQGAEVRLGVSNLLDEDYRTHLQAEAVRRAGRSINLTLTKTF